MSGFVKNIFRKNRDLTVEEVIVKRTFTSFAALFLFFGLSIISWKWIRRQPASSQVRGDIQRPLREILDANEAVFNKLYSSSHLAKTYPVSMATKNVRHNGDVGMGNNFDPAKWNLQVVKKNGDTLRISLDKIKSLPRVDIVFNFKCIEGWNQITHWSGVRFTDFLKAFGLRDESNMAYAGLVTPDNAYYVGIDMASILHPQTILCYELNGEPLPMKEGYPLRLIIPVKYGIKHLKRIGTIFFSDKRPPDYWAERGYDYYSGL